MDRHCRICLKIDKDLFSIYSYQESEYLPTVIYQISGVKLSSEREGEAQICESCACAVVAAQTIILRCQESEEYVSRNLWRRTKLKNESHHAEVTGAEEEVQHLVENLVKEATVVQEEGEEEREDENEEEFDYDHELLPLDGDDEQSLTSTQYAEIASFDEEDDVDELEEEEQKSPLTVGAEEAVEKTPITVDGGSTSAPAPAKKKRTRDPIKTPRFDCDRCDFRTKTGRTLIDHRRNVHDIDDPLIYACTLCPKRFAWKPTLYRHIQGDHKQLPAEKRFVCEICAKAYTRQLHLDEHNRQRHGPRRYKCTDPNCEQTFTRSFTLRRHFQTAHASTLRYHCADCDKYFKIYDLWKYHNEVVHKNATVYCPRCGYPFRFKDKLEEHLQKEVCKRSVIPCPYCQRRFTAKNGLRGHLKNIHHMA